MDVFEQPFSMSHTTSKSSALYCCICLVCLESNEGLYCFSAGLSSAFGGRSPDKMRSSSSGETWSDSISKEDSKSASKSLTFPAFSSLHVTLKFRPKQKRQAMVRPLAVRLGCKAVRGEILEDCQQHVPFNIAVIAFAIGR